MVTRRALVASALESARQAEALGLAHERIVLSCKVSGVQDLIAVYRDLAARCDYALHLGLTEAGMGSKGIVASTAAMAVLLQEGIGDTIRVSLTPGAGRRPHAGSRSSRRRCCRRWDCARSRRWSSPARAAGARRARSSRSWRTGSRAICARRCRCGARATRAWKNMHVAVMGCVVNGPGESKHANIGISLPGSGENPVAPVYVDGVKTVTLKGENIAAEFQKIVEQYVADEISRRTPADDSASRSSTRACMSRHAVAIAARAPLPVTSRQSR